MEKSLEELMESSRESVAPVDLLKSHDQDSNVITAITWNRIFGTVFPLTGRA